MKKNKGFSILVLLLLMLLGISAAAMYRSSSTPVREHISVIVSNSSSGRWASFKAGLHQGAKDREIDLRIVSTDTLRSLEEERRLAQREIDNGADAIILEPVMSDGLEEMVRELGSRVSVLLIETEMDTEKGRKSYSCIRPDNQALGKALGNEVVLGEKNGLKERTVGILAGNGDLQSVQDRMESAGQILRDRGCVIKWTLMSSSRSRIAERLPLMEKVDIILGLSDEMLETAAAYLNGKIFTEETGERPALYGIGISNKSVYYLDHGVIRSMVVPNEFEMGYRSMEEAGEQLHHRKKSGTDRFIDYRIVHQDSIFNEENANLLFPITQ